MISIVLVAGGTAGHTSPMIATAEAIKAADPSARLLCVGTAKGLETTVVPAVGLPLRLIPAVPWPRRLNADMVCLPWRLWDATRQASAILREVGADVVAGFGGYVSLPVYLAARRAHIPVVVQEQNALPGMANKVAARFAQAVLTSFPGTPIRGAQFTGMPVRRAISDLALNGRTTDQAAARSEFGLPLEGPVLLVSGGSQGATRLNDAVLGARERLLASGVSVLHVWGGRNYPEDAEVIEMGGARYVPWSFVEEMARAYAAADLMLARGGASTVSETGSVGLPSIYVPFPHGNGEQWRNAAPLVEAGAGEFVADEDLTPDKVVELVLALCGDPAKLAEMAQIAMSVFKPGDETGAGSGLGLNAAELVAAVILNAGGGDD